MLRSRRARVAPMSKEGRGVDRPTWAPGEVGLARPRAASVRDDNLGGAHSRAVILRPAQPAPPLSPVAPVDRGQWCRPPARGAFPGRQGTGMNHPRHGRPRRRGRPHPEITAAAAGRAPGKEPHPAGGPRARSGSRYAPRTPDRATGQPGRGGTNEQPEGGMVAPSGRRS